MFFLIKNVSTDELYIKSGLDLLLGIVGKT